MRFGRVEGVVEKGMSAQGTNLRLRVFLETGQEWRTVRDEDVPILGSGEQAENLAWQADQYTQETIGVDLATEGWEVIAASDIPVCEQGEMVRSATYAVRQL
jgi:hypothetical protein